MRRISCYVVLVLAVSVIGACASPDSDPRDGAIVGQSDGVADQSAMESGDTSHAATHGESHRELPLRPIMQQLGSNLAAFTHAMLLEDYDQMALFAHEIADHAHISADEISRISEALGPQMEDFEAFDLAVHEAAERLHAATEARNLDAILQELNTMQVGCMNCHTQFRERLRTDLP